jgi:NitT/TauT family transport system substrate-binding protein
MRAGVVLMAVLLASSLGGAIGSSASVAARTGAPNHALSAATCASDKAAGVITFVSPFGFDASVGILDVFAAQSLGYFADECLTVRFVTNSYVPNQLVSSGAGTITGEGSAADAMLAVANGSKFEAISTFGDTSDYAILTRPSIKNLQQLEGATLGYHTTLPVVLTEMMQAAHVDIAKVHEVNDTSYDPTLLITGRFDALQAYRSNEPLTLQAAGDKFNEFVPSQFHVSGTFNVQVANTAFAKAHPSAVANFLRAELHAYDYCVVHVATCINIEAGYAKDAGVTYESAHETAEWIFETGLVKAHSLNGQGVGVESVAEWAPERAAIIKAGLAKASVLSSSIEATGIAKSLYSGTALIWPGK